MPSAEGMRSATERSEALSAKKKLSAQLTDEVCRKKLRFYDSSRHIRNFSTSSAPSGHLLLKEKALTCANTKLTDKSEFENHAE